MWRRRNWIIQTLSRLKTKEIVPGVGKTLDENDCTTSIGARLGLRLGRFKHYRRYVERKVHWNNETHYILYIVAEQFVERFPFSPLYFVYGKVLARFIDFATTAYCYQEYNKYSGPHIRYLSARKFLFYERCHNFKELFAKRFCSISSLAFDIISKLKDWNEFSP